MDNRFKPLFLVQARTGASRLPGKVLMELSPEYSLIEAILDRVRRSRFFAENNLVVLTTESSGDDELADFLADKGIEFFRGDEENVYARFHGFLSTTSGYSHFFRICADNPFLEPIFLDALGRAGAGSDAIYLSYATREAIPTILTHFGFFGELVRVAEFLEAKPKILSKLQREHVTPYFYRTDSLPKTYLELPSELENSAIRLTIDTREDFELAREILAVLPDGFSYREVLAAITSHPQWLSVMEQQIERNAK